MLEGKTGPTVISRGEFIRISRSGNRPEADLATTTDRFITLADLLTDRPQLGRFPDRLILMSTPLFVV